MAKDLLDKLLDKIFDENYTGRHGETLRAKLPQKKQETDRLNEARWVAERQIRQEQQTRPQKKNEPSL